MGARREGGGYTLSSISKKRQIKLRLNQANNLYSARVDQLLSVPYARAIGALYVLLLGDTRRPFLEGLAGIVVSYRRLEGADTGKRGEGPKSVYRQFEFLITTKLK